MKFYLFIVFSHNLPLQWKSLFLLTQNWNILVIIDSQVKNHSIIFYLNSCDNDLAVTVSKVPLGGRHSEPGRHPKCLILNNNKTIAQLNLYLEPTLRCDKKK